MSIIVTSEEIELYRADLANYPDALAALEVLEDCEGDLEDAAITLAIQVGQEPDTSDRWIDGLAKRWRYALCQAELREGLEDGLSGEMLTAIATTTALPMKLATPIAIFVIKTGVDPFCKPLEESGLV
jgi:hypothetical protein